MEARVESEWARGSHKVWLYDRHPRGMVIYRCEPTSEDGVASFRWYTVEMAETEILPAPTFELPRGGLEALIQAASDILPPSAATDRHLKDSITVRDRLLTLVEKLAA